MTSHDDVRAYYDHFGEREWSRLDRPHDGLVEFALTVHTLHTHLPLGGRVLDIGGGPGRYTLWLAERGHRVTLADLSPQLIAIAREKIATSPVAHCVEEIVVADACDLSRWQDASFDAVLALGPFYHLTQPEDRQRAARELVRILRPGGIAFIALMPRYMFVRRTLALADERHHLASEEFVRRLLDEGAFINDQPGRLTEGYGVRPEEVAPFFAEHGLVMQTLLATESIVPDLQTEVAAFATTNRAAYDAMLNILVEAASDPSILGMANHLLFVGEKA